MSPGIVSRVSFLTLKAITQKNIIKPSLNQTSIYNILKLTVVLGRPPKKRPVVSQILNIETSISWNHTPSCFTKVSGVELVTPGKIVNVWKKINTK